MEYEHNDSSTLDPAALVISPQIEAFLFETTKWGNSWLFWDSCLPA